LRTFEKGCASSKKTSGFSKVRTFENRAHLRREVRTFGRAAALHPVPIQRKVAQPPASASSGLFGLAFGSRFIHLCISSLGEANPTSLPQALGPLSRFASMREGPAKKRAVPGFGTAPLRRDLQLVAVPFFVVRTCIMYAVAVSFNGKSFLAL
jgi:hypothetical protein